MQYHVWITHIFINSFLSESPILCCNLSFCLRRYSSLLLLYSWYLEFLCCIFLPTKTQSIRTKDFIYWSFTGTFFKCGKKHIDTLFVVFEMGIIFQDCSNIVLNCSTTRSLSQTYTEHFCLPAAPYSFQTYYSWVVKSMQICFCVLPCGSICVLLSCDLNGTVCGWRDWFLQRRTQPTKTWCLFMSNKLTRTWLNAPYVCLQY